MIAKKNLNPVQRILAWLNEGPEIENYATHEIEALPIEEVRQRLEKLGVDSSLPGYIKNFTGNYASPAHKVVEALDDEIEELSPAELEHLAPGAVSAKLNSLGLNYRAGINKIRELTEARSNHEQRQNRPVKSHLDGIWVRLKIADIIAALAKMREPIAIPRMAGFAAAAAAVLAFVLVISHRSQLQDKRAQSEVVTASGAVAESATGAQSPEEIGRQLTTRGLPSFLTVPSQPNPAVSSANLPSVPPLPGSRESGTQTSSRQQFVAGLEGRLQRQWSSGAPTVNAPTLASAASEQQVMPSGGAKDSVRSFYNVFLGTMKDRTLDKSGRHERLASIVENTFDLPFMAQLVMGQSVWAALPPAQQQKVTEGLRQYIAATYADNFASYSGEELRVIGEWQRGEDVIVKTKIIQSNGETDFIDYLMRHSQGSWKISDAYLDGTVSELAKLRSEIFVPPARGGGRSDERVEPLPAASRFHRDRSGGAGRPSAVDGLRQQRLGTGAPAAGAAPAPPPAVPSGDNSVRLLQSEALRDLKSVAHPGSAH